MLPHMPAGAVEQSQQQATQQQSSVQQRRAPGHMLARLVSMLAATCIVTAGLIAQNTELQLQLRRRLDPIQVGIDSECPQC